jgi:hypothetical protein
MIRINFIVDSVSFSPHELENKHTVLIQYNYGNSNPKSMKSTIEGQKHKNYTNDSTIEGQA